VTRDLLSTNHKIAIQYATTKYNICTQQHEMWNGN